MGIKFLASNESKEILILDTSAFLGGYNPNLINMEQRTIPEVLNEVKTPSIRSIIDISIVSGKLHLHSPSSDSIEEIKKVGELSGDNFVLSEIDIKILALALEVRQDGFKPTLITDDYAIQNAAGKLKINFKPIIEKGIQNLIQWTIYCPGCKKNFPSKLKTKICPNCGTPLKRFSSKKSEK